MAKRKSDRLKVLQRLADRCEQLAAQNLGKSQGNLQQQQLRLQELIEFRTEYAQQFQQNGVNGMDGSSVQAFQSFIVQLDGIIEQQKQTIRLAELDCTDKKEQWQDKHKTTRIYDKTIERAVNKEQKSQKRTEQLDADEHAQRQKSPQTSK